MSDFWQGRKVLVTGAAGFIGHHLVPYLLERGAVIRAVDNLERGKKEDLAGVLDRIEFREEDLTDRDVAMRAVEGMDTVIHLASKVGGIKVYTDHPYSVFEHAMRIDLNVFRAAIDHKVDRLFYASSAHVYPEELQLEIECPKIREEQAYPASPALSYGWAKLMSERMLADLHAEYDGPRYAIARIIGAYGPGQDIGLDTGSVIPVFSHRAVIYPERAPFRILGGGTETRSYFYVHDLLRAIDLMVREIDCCTEAGPLNVGSEMIVSINEIAEKVVDISGKDIEVYRDESHPTKIWGQRLDCSKIRDLLGWEAEVPFETGLARVYQDVTKRLERA